MPKHYSLLFAAVFSGAYALASVKGFPGTRRPELGEKPTSPANSDDLSPRNAETPLNVGPQEGRTLGVEPAPFTFTEEDSKEHPGRKVFRIQSVNPKRESKYKVGDVLDHVPTP